VKPKEGLGPALGKHNLNDRAKNQHPVKQMNKKKKNGEGRPKTRRHRHEKKGASQNETWYLKKRRPCERGATRKKKNHMKKYPFKSM